ncbi:pancreatic triacylglycerol lipase-like [Euwallacea similis]|uniref:pancreatic triacylglycerol lipase-like n=1 Tax=Euwallacea similis TaxID=1736056 RepID=UPI00344DFC9E
MILRNTLLFVLICATFSNGQLFSHPRFAQFPIKAAQKLKERLREKLNQYRERTTQMICYDVVGCFSLPHKNSPLQKVPDDPRFLDTKFYLFTRKNASLAELLHYGDEGKSLRESTFNVFKPLKVLIHGYTSNWNEKGALMVKDSYLKLYDCNVVLVDWKLGARGPHYTSAAANTELVGRELGILLVTMVESGLNPKNIHLIGFSLGAHVAGTASETLKQKNHLIGRITGLDAASPLFRRNHFREKNKKLDRSDAEFVDVLHTDSSPFVTDGFGLWEPIGHVDFFPNGGQQQPGCKDARSSIVDTYLEGGTLNRDSACSHIRAFQLFLETIINKVNNLNQKDKNYCQFTAYNCPGGMPSYEKGHCFPLLQKSSSMMIDPMYKVDEIGQFGEDVKGEGIMYFSSRESSPFCGTQLQASVHVSHRTTSIKGILQMVLFYRNTSITFQIETNTQDLVMSGSRMNGRAVAEFNSLDPTKVKNIHTNLHFFNVDEESTTNHTLRSSILFTDKIIIRDMYGNSWQHCEKDLMISDTNPKRIILSSEIC